MKLLIGIPTNRDWKPLFALSLIDLVNHLSKRGIESANGIFFSSCLSKSRQALVNEAIDGGYTHLLFIDDDMKFDAKAFDSLLSRDKDFVAPNIALRNTKPVITNTMGIDKNNISSIGKTGIERILLTGLAFALIKTDAIKKILKPHFEVKWDTKTQNYVHEDEFFCNALKNTGTELYIDHDAARYIWHLGTDAQQENFSN